MVMPREVHPQVQPEMEKQRFPLVSIPPIGQDHSSSKMWIGLSFRKNEGVLG
jgi:hypothetical protein